MFRLLGITFSIGLAAMAQVQQSQGQQSVQTQTQQGQAPPAGRGRPGPPARDPHTEGYAKATELPDGTIPKPNQDGNFIIGPTHPAAPEWNAQEGVPDELVTSFVMDSNDSK